MQPRLVRERKAGVLVCEHCGIQRLPSTKHVRRCELDQEKKARELAERSRAHAARSEPLLRPPPRKLQRRSSVGVDRPHEATGLHLDVSEGDDDIGGGGAVDGNSGDKAVADEHAPADPPLAEDAVEGDAVSVPSPTFAQVRCVPVMARPAFLRPVLPPGGERLLSAVEGLKEQQQQLVTAVNNLRADQKQQFVDQTTALNVHGFKPLVKLVEKLTEKVNKLEGAVDNGVEPDRPRVTAAITLAMFKHGLMPSYSEVRASPP